MLDINLLLLLSGLGVFLYAMALIERSFSQLGSRKLNQYLSLSTSTPLAAITTGAVATAIVQSSSLVGLIVLALASANILKLNQSIAVIIGANLGTTMTGWMVTFLGFKLNLGSFAIYIIGVSALANVFAQDKSKLKLISNVLISIGLIFFALELIKDSVASLQYSFDINLLKNQALITYLLVGMVLSAVIQSSSAVMVMTLSAVSASIIGIEAAAALVIGADLGTTSTVALGSIKGANIKKKLAFAHFSFNLLTNIFAFLVLLPALPWLLQKLSITDPLISLVFFHSLFNFAGILLFFPWLNKFAGFMKKLFNSTDESIESRLKAFPAEVTELALKSMRNEIFIFMDKVNRENLKILEFRTSDYKSYAELKKLENIFIQYNHRLLAQSLSEEQLVEIDRLLTAVRHSIYSAKSLKDIIDDFDDYLVKEMLLDELNNNLLRQAKHYLESTIKLMAEEPESIDNIYLETWHQALTESLNRTHAKITHHLQISEEMSLDVRSTLLNINKEIFTSCKYSQRALQAFIKAE